MASGNVQWQLSLPRSAQVEPIKLLMNVHDEDTEGHGTQDQRVVQDAGNGEGDLDQYCRDHEA